MVIDHVNYVLAKKSIKPKATLEMIDWKLNRVLEQTLQIPETKRKSVQPVKTKSKGNSNRNSNLTKNVNPEIRSETAGVTGPQVNDTARTWSQILGKATVNSKNWTTVLDPKKQTRTTTIIRMRTNSIILTISRRSNLDG